MAAVITATNSASSERSGPVTAGAAAGLTAGTGAAFGAGAAAFFFPSSHAWMYLKHESDTDEDQNKEITDEPIPN